MSSFRRCRLQAFIYRNTKVDAEWTGTLPFMDDTQHRAVYVRSSECETHAPPGGEVTKILATARETGGRVTVMESVLPKGLGAPWHYHDVDDEMFYVISGLVEFGVGDRTVVAEPGDYVNAGPRVPRRFTALSDSKFLVMNSPSGPAEGFIRDISTLEGPPTKADEERFAREYGIHLIPCGEEPKS